MKEKNYNSIKNGILAVFMLSLFLAPLSYSLKSSTVSVDEITQAHPTHGIQVTQALAQTPVNKNPQTSDAPKTEGQNHESLLSAFDIGDKIIIAVGNALLNIASAVTYIGGKLLEFAITKLVLGMGNLINNEGLGVAIDSLWKIIRDISNLAFIFGFIYIGIRTIIDPENASTKRFLAKIIIGALLINFSLFFVKAVIDFSNFTATQIYNAMIVGNGSLSAAVTKLLGISDFFAPNVNALATFTGKPSGIWFFVFASIFLVVTGFVFAAAAITLVIRFVALVMIMVFSPILFAATVFPQTEQYADDLWKKLFSYSLQAPAYLLLTFITIKLVENLHIKPAGATFVNAMERQGTTESFGVILQFVIIIFFMISTLSLTGKFGSSAGEMITAKTKAFVGASTAGLAARTGRATAGRLGNWISEKDGLKDAAAQGGVKGWGARMALKSSRGISDASFDARNTSIGKSAGVGTGRKGGYATVKKEIIEKEEKFAKSLGEVGDSDFRVEARKKEAEKKKSDLAKDKEKLTAEKKELSILNTEIKKAIARGDSNSAGRLQVDAEALRVSVAEKEEHVKHVEHEAHEADIAYASEKQRRILGSTYLDSSLSKNSASNIKDVVATQKREIGEEKGKLDAKWKEYLETSDDTQKKAFAKDIENFKANIKAREKALHQTLLENSDMGRAGVLENSKWYTAWPAGRLVTHEVSAGEGMRKTFSKGIPKAKDDHGGGDHGGDHEEEHHEPAHTPAPAPRAAPHAAPAGGGGHDAHGHTPAAGGGHDAHH